MDTSRNGLSSNPREDVLPLEKMGPWVLEGEAESKGTGPWESTISRRMRWTQGVGWHFHSRLSGG